MKRKDLKALARVRLREARALLAKREYAGAYYLAGYVVECGLKACIAKKTERYEFPDKNRAEKSWKHKADDLVKAAGLEALLNAEKWADKRFEVYWNVVKDWTETSRYEQTDQRKAESLIRAISDRDHRVLRWLRHHW